MKKFRKTIAALAALSIGFSSVSQVVNAYDVQIDTGKKSAYSQSDFSDAEEITDEYILNTFLADMFKDITINNGFVYLNGREHKVYAYDKCALKGSEKRRPDIFYVTYDHPGQICLVRSEESDFTEFETLVKDFLKENGTEAEIRAESSRFYIKGYDGIDEVLADSLGDFLDEKGMIKSVSFTPSYDDIETFVIPYRYPYSFAPVINRLIPELGLSRRDVYVDVSEGDCKVRCNSGNVTQKQMLKLAAEIYRKTGFIEIEYGPYEKYNGDKSLVWIDSHPMDSEKYETAAGLPVLNHGYSRYHEGAVKVTDERITAFYTELARKSNPNMMSDRYMGNFREFYAYDTVHYDNSKFNGEVMNLSLLLDGLICMMDFPSHLSLYFNADDMKALAAELDEKFELSGKNIRINASQGDMDIRGFYSDMTEELADSIFKELKDRGYNPRAEFRTCALSDGMLPEGSSGTPEYPESRREEIMAIVSESGVKATARSCHHYTDDESGYFDLVFEDVYSTTQLDVAKLRTEIYERTGECGLIDAGEFKPEYSGCLQFGVTDAVTAPDRMTYVDVVLGQNTGFNIFVTDINYDHDNLELVSASLKKELGRNIDFDLSDSKSRMLLSCKKAENLEMSNEDVIRLAFKVKAEAPDGKYEVSLSVPENQETGVCSVRGSSVEWVNSEFTPGYITVDSKAVPKTQTKPMPLNRMYAVIKDDDKVLKSGMTGDINDDGVLNVMDVMRMKRYFVNPENSISNADVNEDGILNVADIVVLSANVLNGED